MNHTDSLEADVEFFYLTGGGIAQAWPWLSPFIECALDDTLSLDTVEELLLTGRALAWIVCKDDEFEAVCVTREQVFPDKRILEVMTMGGEGFTKWGQALVDLLSEHMELHGIDEMRAYCRPGMARTLKRFGWKTHQEVMSYGVRKGR